MSTLATSLYGSEVNKGYGGLASGLDTDELVNQMAAGTKNKINKQYQEKQKLLYKQEAYREISKKLLDFNNKYFSYASDSSSNILSADFFKSNNFESSSQYVNVTGDASNIKNFTIDSITSVATSANFTSTYKVSDHTFRSDDFKSYISSIAGETMSIAYDNKTYNLTIDRDFGRSDSQTTLQDVADQLNEQLKSVEGNENNDILKYKVDGDRLVFEKGSAALVAAGSKILSNLNMKVGHVAASESDIDPNALSTTKAQVLSNKEAYMTFDFNGVQKTIHLKDSATAITDADSLKTFLQNELDDAYGAGKVSVDSTGGKLSFSATSETDLFGIPSLSKELSCYTGIDSSTYNRVSKTKEIGEAGLAGILTSGTLSSGEEGYAISINGKEFEFEKASTLSDIIREINSESDVTIYHSSTTDTFTVKAKETGSHKGVLIENVTGKGNLADMLFGTSGTDYNIVNGTDTEMTYTLNGIQTTVNRSTANFSIDGINVELNEKAKGITEPVTFDVTSNTDEIVDRLKDFLTDYNEIITLIGDKISEKPDSDYQPLTPDQKDEMEKEEIEDWTEQVKKGILFGDSKMRNVFYGLRGAMSSVTSGSTFILKDIGIGGSAYDTSGKLTIDVDELKNRLTENPDEVARLFTNSTEADDDIDGIAVQIKSLLKTNIGNYGTTGILIDEAGLDSGLTSDQNNISEKIDDYDDRLKELKKDYKREKQRYWDKFTALEEAMNKLNAQSSQLTGLLGS